MISPMDDALRCWMLQEGVSLPAILRPVPLPWRAIPPVV